MFHPLTMSKRRASSPSPEEKPAKRIKKEREEPPPLLPLVSAAAGVPVPVAVAPVIAAPVAVRPLTNLTDLYAVHLNMGDYGRILWMLQDMDGTSIFNSAFIDLLNQALCRGKDVFLLVHDANGQKKLLLAVRDVDRMVSVKFKNITDDAHRQLMRDLRKYCARCQILDPFEFARLKACKNYSFDGQVWAVHRSSRRDTFTELRGISLSYSAWLEWLEPSRIHLMHRYPDIEKALAYHVKTTIGMCRRNGVPCLFLVFHEDDWNRRVNETMVEATYLASIALFDDKLPTSIKKSEGILRSLLTSS